mgnify:FL=1
MLPQFFELTLNGVRIAEPSVLLYKAINRIYLRDGSASKQRAFKDFEYIFKLIDPRSYPHINGFSDEDTKRWVHQNMDKPDDFEPDAELLEAMYEYHGLVYNTPYKILDEIEQTLNMKLKIIQKYRKFIDNSLASEASMVEIKNYLAIQSTIETMLSEFPTNIQKLEMARKSIHALNDNGGGIARGGAIITESMDPDKAMR